MKKVKLARLPDRVPVKMQITLPPELAARLRDYADRSDLRRARGAG